MEARKVLSSQLSTSQEEAKKLQGKLLSTQQILDELTTRFRQQHKAIISVRKQADEDKATLQTFLSVIALKDTYMKDRIESAPNLEEKLHVLIEAHKPHDNSTNGTSRLNELLLATNHKIGDGVLPFLSQNSKCCVAARLSDWQWYVGLSAILHQEMLGCRERSKRQKSCSRGGRIVG